MAREAATRSRFRFFGGKGGVGKTTCAAAAALVAARAGQRVLLVSTDPAHSLGHVFARPFASCPRCVPTARGTLDVVELDADRALGRFIGQHRFALRRIVARGTYLDDSDIDALLRLAFPGVDELVGLLELTRLADGGGYPEVVVDTAPTGHTLRLLGMPAILRRTGDILDDMLAKHRYLSESLGGRYRRDASDFVIEEIAGQGRALEELLRDPDRSAFRWVTLPEAVAMEEARDGIAALRGAGIAVTELLVNRVTPSSGGRCRLCDRRRAAERRVIAGARDLFRGIPVRCVPALAEEPRGSESLRRLGRWLDGRSRESPRRRAHSERPASAPRPATTSQTWLDAISPPGVRLLLFAGKGGVGKTTCAAAIALALAERAPDQKVLLVSADPAHSLGDVLAAPIDDVLRPVPGGPPGLRAREVDAKALLAARRRRYLDSVASAAAELRGGSRFDFAFDRAVVEDLIDLAPPGIDELLGLLAIADALHPRPGADPCDTTIVVDTAPTGHLLRLLAMPATGLEWVHTLMALLLKYRQVTGLGQLGSDLVEISRELKHLQAVLTDPQRARLVVVARATEMTRLETRSLMGGVSALGVGVSSAIVNALTPAGCARCRRARGAEQRVAAAIRSDLSELAASPCAIMGTLAIAPPPRGPAALRHWRRTWTRLDR